MPVSTTATATPLRYSISSEVIQLHLGRYCLWTVVIVISLIFHFSLLQFPNLSRDTSGRWPAQSPLLWVPIMPLLWLSRPCHSNDLMSSYSISSVNYWSMMSFKPGTDQYSNIILDFCQQQLELEVSFCIKKYVKPAFKLYFLCRLDCLAVIYVKGSPSHPANLIIMLLICASVHSLKV